MSLYNDLTTVLTPYANKIKQNESDIGDIQDALDHLDVETDKTLSVDGKPADAKAIGDAINEVKADLVELIGAEIIESVSNKHINLSGSSVNMSDGHPVYSSGSTNYSCGYISCAGGDKFTINGTGGIDSRLWGFVDSSGAILSVSGRSETATNLILTAPENSAFIIVHTNDGRTSYKGEDIKYLLSSMNEKISSNESDISNLESFFNNPNVLDYSSVSFTNKYPNFSGIIASGTSSKSVVFRVTPNTTYYLRVSGGYNRRVLVGDGDNIFNVGETYPVIESVAKDNLTGVVFTTPSSTNYVLVYFYSGDRVFSADDFELYIGGDIPENTNPTLREDVLPIINESIPYDARIGSYIAYTSGQVASSSNYSTTLPFYLKHGENIIIYAAGDTSISILSLFDPEANTYTPVIRGINPANTTKKYVFTVEQSGLYVISYRSATAELQVIRKKTEKDAITDVIGKGDETVGLFFKQKTIAPNLSIKAFKTITYTDGTTPNSAMVLWQNINTETYYISRNIYSSREKAFVWDRTISGYGSDSYSAVILPNGDVLFVYQTQFDSNLSTATPGDNWRKNPIIYVAAEGYEPHEIDFGASLKPTGWLQNVGVLFSYADNKLFIAEYTRQNELFGRVWAVSMPVTNPSNWSVILTKEIGTPYGRGFKHFHTAQQDPWTGTIYFSSGDDAASSAVWYTKDGGATLTQLDDYDDDKYRMLNMAFTEDYIYWASDDWYPTHSLWRASRNNNGVIDATSLTKLLSFNDELVDGISRIATYATVYIPSYKSLVFLDREDEPRHSEIPIKVYDIESGNLYTAASLKPITSGVNAGFRNTAVMCYPKSNRFVVSFDKRYPNNNALLGNTDSDHINNIVIEVFKSGSGYVTTFDTVY